MQTPEAPISDIIPKPVESSIPKGLLVLNDPPSSTMGTEESIVSQHPKETKGSFFDEAKGPDEPLNEE